MERSEGRQVDEIEMHSTCDRVPRRGAMLLLMFYEGVRGRRHNFGPKTGDNAVAAGNNYMYLPPTEVENILFSLSALRLGAHTHAVDQTLILQRQSWATLRGWLPRKQAAAVAQGREMVGWRNYQWSTFNGKLLYTGI